MKNFFTIGQLSSLFKIDPQTLRYYDKIGLFSPIKRDEENDYRYYQFDQLYKLASIRYLRKLGYSIKQIEDYMNSRKVDFVVEYLKEQSKSLHARWEELIHTDKIIQRKVTFIEEEVPKVDLKNFKIKEFSTRYYIPLGKEEELYAKDSFYFYPTIAFYDGDIKYFGAYLRGDYDKDMLKTKVDMEVIPEGLYFSGYHLGPYETIEDTRDRMIKTASKIGIKIEDKSINFNIIDQFVERDVNNYVTEIQIKIVD